MSKLYDISQVLRPGLPVWPGDTPFGLERTWSIASGGVVNVSRLVLSTHSGAHADAPLHYRQGAEDSACSDPEIYIGPALLVDMRHAGHAIRPEHIDPLALSGVKRLLMRTYDRFPHEGWREDYTCVTAEAVDRLAAAGVRLIGIDSPSLDPQTSKTMDAHHAVAKADMRILEGLVLDDVPPGIYELIAPPLRIAGADASPVRALLRTPPP